MSLSGGIIQSKSWKISHCAVWIVQRQLFELIVTTGI